VSPSSSDTEDSFWMGGVSMLDMLWFSRPRSQSSFTFWGRLANSSWEHRQTQRSRFDFLHCCLKVEPNCFLTCCFFLSLFFTAISRFLVKLFSFENFCFWFCSSLSRNCTSSFWGNKSPIFIYYTIFHTITKLPMMKDISIVKLHREEGKINDGERLLRMLEGGFCGILDV